MSTERVLEIELVVLSEMVLQAHPEVYHYTDERGFEGIVKSNTLWASFYKDLNDTTEVTSLREPLRHALGKYFVQTIRTKARDSLKVTLETKRRGGVLAWAQSAAQGLVSALYESAFESADGHSLVDPFIVSFCSHPERYEQKNGLLSQWRGYGRDGGYCIVFDTKRLADLLTREQDRHYYVYGSIWPVAYSHDSFDMNERFPNLVAGCAEVFSAAIEHQIANRHNLNPSVEIPSEQLAYFISGVTLFKHQGFKEEAEVRLAALIGNDYTVKLGLQEDPNFVFSPLKEVHTLVRSDGSPRRFIKLFEALRGEQLPIKRIIVGPSRHQNENVEKARALVGTSIPVSPSETPYLSLD